MVDLLMCFFFKQKTAYEMRISDWSSDVCSSDLQMEHFSRGQPIACGPINLDQPIHQAMETARARQFPGVRFAEDFDPSLPLVHGNHDAMVQVRSEERRVGKECVSKGRFWWSRYL